MTVVIVLIHLFSTLDKMNAVYVMVEMSVKQLQKIIVVMVVMVMVVTGLMIMKRMVHGVHMQAHVKIYVDLNLIIQKILMVMGTMIW